MKIAMILHGKYKNDSRVIKELETLKKLKEISSITLYARGDYGFKKRESFGKIEIRRHQKRKGSSNTFSKIIEFISYFYWVVRENRKESKVDIVHAHDAVGLLVGSIVSQTTKAKLIYDSHEIQSERCTDKKIINKISLMVELILINKAEKIIVVSNSIKKWYEKRFRVNNVTVIRNIPSISAPTKHVDLRKRLGIGRNILFIYLGNLTPKKRAIEELIQVFKCEENQEKHILFMGNGKLKEDVKYAAKTMHNIHYIQSVDPSLVLSFAKEADIGINLGVSNCLNAYYGLANKLFEYISAGLAVIVSDYPERASIIDKLDIGWKINTENGFETQKIKDVISKIGFEEVKRKKQNSIRNKHTYTWEKESEKLIELYGDHFEKKK